MREREQAESVPEMRLAVYDWHKKNKRKYPELRLLYVQRSDFALCLPVPRGNFSSLYIRLKTKECNFTLPEVESLKLLNEYGNLAVVCFSSADAINTIIQYLELKNERTT
jgi:hypothetical protein